jgi:hypothetical protein
MLETVARPLLSGGLHTSTKSAPTSGSKGARVLVSTVPSVVGSSKTGVPSLWPFTVKICRQLSLARIMWYHV